MTKRNSSEGRKARAIPAHLCQFPLLGGNQVIQPVGLTPLGRGRIDTGHQVGVGNRQMHLLLDGEQDGGLQTVMLDRVHGAGVFGHILVGGAGVIYVPVFV